MAHYFLQKIASGLDAINAAIGNAAQWLTLIMVLVQFLVVILRYVFGIGSIQLQEAIIYMHGILFLSAAAATWQDDSHVRVDVFYATASEKNKSANKFLGHSLFCNSSNYSYSLCIFRVCQYVLGCSRILPRNKRPPLSFCFQNIHSYFCCSNTRTRDFDFVSRWQINTTDMIAKYI